MKYMFKLEELECANCAAKMETEINKIAGVGFATVSYMHQKLIIETETENIDKILKEAQTVIKRTEPDCRIVK